MHFSTKFRYCLACGSANFVANDEKSMRCADCRFVYYINPSAATAAFITNAEGELLVCRRGKDPAKGTLDLPGGFADINETAEQAIAREIYEELNLKVHSLKYIFSLPNLYRYSGLDIPTLDLFFEATIIDFSPLKAADDVEMAYFLPKEKLNPNLFGLSSIQKAVELYVSSKI
jgi:ADP-ribose pyrophosphatase YjhB (NUDIX family)